MRYLATFHTHYGAVSFYKICKINGVPAKMSPVPRELSASCGVCVRFDADCVPDIGEYEDMESIFTDTHGGGRFILAAR